MTMPDERARAQILKTMSKNMRLDGQFDFASIARKTPGFVGADLSALIKEAAVLAVNRIFHQIISLPLYEESSAEMAVEDCNDFGSQSVMIKRQKEASDLAQRQYISKILKNRTEPLTAQELEPLCITMQDFEVAVPKVQPSSKREGYIFIFG